MMRNRFDRQLTELNQDMIQMGHMIGQAIGMAISALNNRDKEQAEKAISRISACGFFCSSSLWQGICA